MATLFETVEDTLSKKYPRIDRQRFVDAGLYVALLRALDLQTEGEMRDPENLGRTDLFDKPIENADAPRIQKIIDDVIETVANTMRLQ